MSLNLPPSWSRMSDHNRALYMLNAHLAKTYAEARRKVGRMERVERAKVSVAAYQERLEKLRLA